MKHAKNAEQKTNAIHNQHQQKAAPPTSGQPSGGNQNTHKPVPTNSGDQSSTYNPPDTASC